MKYIQIIEELLPWVSIKEIAIVLEEGSKEEGSGVLTCDKSYCYYLWKFYKHIFRWAFGFRFDKDSHCSHLAHAIIRLMQMLLKSKAVK